jgi:hypothetical protein
LDLLPGEVDVDATLGVGVGVVRFRTVFALLDPLMEGVRDDPQEGQVRGAELPWAL